MLRGEFLILTWSDEIGCLDYLNNNYKSNKQVDFCPFLFIKITFNINVGRDLGQIPRRAINSQGREVTENFCYFLLVGSIRII